MDTQRYFLWLMLVLIVTTLWVPFHQFYIESFKRKQAPDNDLSHFPRRSRTIMNEFPKHRRSRKGDLQVPPGTQMGLEQIKSVLNAVGPSGNLLVWGLGNDSPFWNNITNGRVVFLEDDIPEAKAGTLWYDVITKKYPFLEAYRVHYHTDTVKSFDRYINSPNRWHELALNDIPDSIREENWNVILVDAPLGCCNAGPGRYQSLYESRRLANNRTHIFVDDYERKVERRFSQAVFRKPPDVVVTRKKGASNANEQAHFLPPLNVKLKSPPKWTILLTVNDGFYDFFQNWWAYFKRLNISQKVVVVAEDDHVYRKLQLNTFLTVERSQLNQTSSHAYNTKAYKRMVSMRPKYILRHLRDGENVLYTDTDTVWLKDPFQHLSDNVDFTAQLDGPAYYCTGFMGIQSNARTIQLIKNWDAFLVKTPQLNQPVFNKLLKRSNNIRHRGLSPALFPNGRKYFKSMNPIKKKYVVVVHNNYIIGHDAKKARFKENKLWIY